MLKDIDWLKEHLGLSDLRWAEDKESEFFRGYSAALDIAKSLVNKMDEPKPLIIPHFVDKWLKKRRKDFKTSHDAILYINSYGWDDETHIDFKLYKWIPDNVELFARAWNNIYIVEEY